MKFFDPEARFILQWNKSFLLCSVIALSLDPLFFYIPIVDGTNKCLDVDRKLEIAVCVLRSLADMLYVVHIIIQFRTGYVPHYNPILEQRVFIDEPHYVARRYLKSYFITDVLAALLLPQFAVLVIIPSLDGPTSFLTKNLLKFYSQQWRTWAACYIQHAWHKHCKRKLEKLLEEENRRLQEALATSREASTLSVGAAINVSRFSSNTLHILRRKHMHYELASTPKFKLSVTKPAEPYFDD